MEWKIRKDWTIVPEKVFDATTFDVPAIAHLLKELDLMSSVTLPNTSDHQLVMEVIANLEEGFADKKRKEYGTVFVRREVVKITPDIINSYLGVRGIEDEINLPSMDEIAKVITAGNIVAWPGTKAILASSLTSLYAVLHTILVANWIPTTHRQTVTIPAAKLLYTIGQRKKINLGALIFNNLASHVTSKAPKHPIGYPSLIHELVVRQAPGIRKEGDQLSEPLKKISTDHKLFSGNHVVDVEKVKKTQGAKKGVKMEQTVPRTSGRVSEKLQEKFVSYFEQRMSAIEKEQKELRELFTQIFEVQDMAEDDPEEEEEPVDSDDDTAAE